jgi:hypothetical protein
LQKVMDNSCMFQACENGKPLKSQGVAAMNACAVKSSVKENIDGCKCSLFLCGCWTWMLIYGVGLKEMPGQGMPM